MGDNATKMQIVDYTQYSNESLLEAAYNVNRTKYPYIWHTIKAELDRRGLIDPTHPKVPEAQGLPPVSEIVSTDEILAAIKKLEQGGDPKDWQKNLLTLIATIFLFGLAQMQMDLGQKVLGIILALLIHEAGHILAMRFCNYKNLRILMIPLFGAVAIGNPTDRSAKKAAVVAIAGPLFGLLSAVIAAEIYHVTNFTFAMEYAAIAFTLNIFNLLPIRPFDGGAFLNELLFCRYPVAQVAFGVFSVLLCLVPSIMAKQVIPFHLIIAWMVVIQTQTGYFFTKTARKLHSDDANSGDTVTAAQVTTILEEYQKGASAAFNQLNAKEDKVDRWAQIVRSISMESRKTYMSPRDALTIFGASVFLIGALWAGMNFSDHIWRVKALKEGANAQSLRLHDIQAAFSFAKGNDFAGLKNKWNEECTAKRDFHCRLASYFLEIEGQNAEALELQKISCSKEDPHSCYNVYDNDLTKDTERTAASAILDDVCQKESLKNQTCCTCYADAKERRAKAVAK